MFDDPIVSETRAVRDEYAASFGYDLGRIVLDLQSRQGKDGRQIVDRTTVPIPVQNDGPEPPAAQVTDGASSPTVR